MKLVFVHGWGFDRTLWDGVAAALPALDKTLVELGFLGGEPSDPAVQDDAVLIGHSLGLLWGMAQRKDWRAVIAINSFARFAGSAEEGACASPATLRAMRLGLARDPDRTLGKFCHRLGCAWTPTDFDVQRLMDGLTLLDGECLAGPLDAPVLVLAARNDPVVPVTASEHLAAITGSQVVWQDEGGHLLPLTHASWCADEIAAFLR